MKKIKILTITLIVVAITMIAFFGVYTKVQNRMENQVKDYDFAMDLKGSRNIKLKVSEDNNAETKTAENYQISKKIIEKRLQKLGIGNYIIKLDKETGSILVEVTENKATDQIVSNLNTTGKFEMVDSETKEVLLNNEKIKQARVMSGSNGSTSRGTTVYLEIEFNQEGTKKLEDISKQYVKVENTTSGNEVSENTTETNETEENTETKTEKKVTINLDGEEIMSTSFENPIKTGKIQLSIGSSSTDQKTLQGYVNQAASIATVLNTGSMPIQYEIEENQYILSDITDREISIAIYIILGMIGIGMIAIIVKYKKIGALGVISYIGFVSLFMIIIRYANVVLSIEGIFGVLIAFILNYILLYQLLAKVEDRKTVYKNYWIRMIPVIITVVTFCFINWIPISSFGMTMIWGIALIAIYNGIVTNSLFKIDARKE